MLWGWSHVIQGGTLTSMGGTLVMGGDTLPAVLWYLLSVASNMYIEWSREYWSGMVTMYSFEKGQTKLSS